MTPAQAEIRDESASTLPPVNAAAQVQKTERDETQAKAEGDAAAPETEARAAAVGVDSPDLPSPPAPDVQTTKRLGDVRLENSAAGPEFTLEEAIGLTLLNNPQRAATRAALAASQARVGTAKSQGGLQVGLSGNASGTGNFGSTSSNGNNGGGNNGGNNNGGVGGNNGGAGGNFGGSNSGDRFSNSQSIGVTADYPIYTGGRVKAATRIADFNARAQAAQVLQTEQDLILQASNAYLNILRSDQLLRVADSNLAVSRERQRVATVRYEAGASARVDVYRANTVLAEAQQTRIAAVNAASQARANLNTLMGRLPEAPLRVASIDRLELRVPLPLEVAAEARAGSPTASLLELQTLASRSRPQGEVARNQVFAADAGIESARAQRKPNLGLSLSGFLRNPASFLGNFAVSLGLSVAQSLFDSGRTSAQVREARALADQSRANFDLQLLGVANQIETAITNIDTAQGQQQSAEASVGEAQAALAAAQLGYEAGARTAVEVTDAQTALLNAQTAAVNARFNLAQAQAQLSSAVGVATAEGQNAYRVALQQEKSGTQSTLSKELTAANAARRKELGIPERK
jgi:outer membrane protein